MERNQRIRLNCHVSCRRCVLLDRKNARKYAINLLSKILCQFLTKISQAIGGHEPCISQKTESSRVTVYLIRDTFTHVRFIRYDAFILRLYINDNDVYKLISLYRKIL